MRNSRSIFLRTVQVCCLLTPFLFSGCATFITTNTARDVDSWNRTIEHVPLDQLLRLHEGDQLLITLQDETEIEGKLQSVLLDTTLVIRSGNLTDGHQTRNIHHSELLYVRLIQKPILRRMTGLILGVPVDLVALAAGFVFSAFTIIVLIIIFG